MFYIGFISAPRVNDEGWPHAVGELTLGDYSERFEASLVHWSMREYEEQWRQAIARLGGGAPSSALITSYGGPAVISTIWPVWREGREAVFQERLVVPGDAGAALEPARAYEQLGARVSVGEEAPVSEWTIPMAQVLAYVLD